MELPEVPSTEVEERVESKADTGGGYRTLPRDTNAT